MAKRLKRFCRADGCTNLTDNPNGFCGVHQFIAQEKERRRDLRRGTATQRGYNSKWRRYSQWFLSLPQNKFCALRLDDKCAIVAQCVDHIDPPESANDPKFWMRSNHQPACIHCNSVKNNRKIVGKFGVNIDDDLF